MKLLFDQNLSPKLIFWLKDSFPGSKHLQDLGLNEASDKEVWLFAKDNNFIIISKDTDFINLHSINGFPPKIIWLKKGNCSTRSIYQIIYKHTNRIKTFIRDSNHGILILN